MKKVIESIFIYFALVFHPWVLVKIAREYLVLLKGLKEVNSSAKELISILHTPLYK